MALFQFLWLRRLIRRHTKPIAEGTAHVWKKRLSVVYMLAAWNAFGLVCYMVYTGRGDWADYYGYKSAEEKKLSPAQQWTRTLGIKDATVYRVSGLNVQKYEIHNDLEDNSKTQETSTDTVPVTESLAA